MSLVIENNKIHLIGNVEKGYVDKHVILPFLNVFNMVEEYSNEVELHLSGRDSLCDISPIIDVIKNSKIPVNIYIENSEILGGYNGVDGKLKELLNLGYYDNTNNEYNPPLHLSLAEIHMMREIDNYKEDIEYEEEDY